MGKDCCTKPVFVSYRLCLRHGITLVHRLYILSGLTQNELLIQFPAALEKDFSVVEDVGCDLVFLF